MSHSRTHSIVAVLCLFSVVIANAEIFVNINVNKPIHDVSEQFVSFSIPPELLFESLDGPKKRTLTEMASLLGPSYLRMTGNYFFPSDMKSSLKNPTLSIWSGFNRWTRAMNWTMVIPVQYTPPSWDPIEALRILNNSNTVGIDNCIWQLGLDFGALRAADYVADLNTLDTMVDTFRPYVKNWKVIGAEITAGSSADETKRYIDMSKDVNTAFGWTPPAGENPNSIVYDKDLSLRVMMDKKVPVWLSVPPNPRVTQKSNGFTNMDVSEAIRWAQTLGEAATSGFDAVFKPLSTEDVRSPNPSFYVTALFKKIMGNRVFAAKPVKRFTYATKLYSHCANGISGGIAFLGVNPEDYVVKIAAKISAKATGSEVWQYILTSKKGTMYLNNRPLSLNSSIEPLIKIKHPNKPLAITLPPMSVGFWVLPQANHDDCQFTDLLTNQESQWESRQRRQTSSDRLLKKLILETSLTDQMKNRPRRDTSSINRITRQKRFILQNTAASKPSPARLSLQERNLKKREDTTAWLKTLIMKPVVDWNLKRSRRATDFSNSMSCKESPASTKERKSAKLRYPSEESIFKTKVINRPVEIPQGDVHFQYITNVDGEELSIKDSREEEKPDTTFRIRELPSEFYATIFNEKYPSPSTAETAAPKDDEILDIDGDTMYMSRKHLVNTFMERTNKPKSAFSPWQSANEEGQGQTKSAVVTEFTLDSYPILQDDNSEEKSSSGLGQFPWGSTDRRSRRSIDFGKLKSWKDNMISIDEEEPPFANMIPEMIGESTPGKSGVPSDGKIGTAADVHINFSKILSAVKTHISSFINSFVK